MQYLSLIEKAFFLKKVSLFKTLDLDLLLAIADKLHQDDYDLGEVVFKQDQTANRMYFIESGEIELRLENVPIKTLEKYDFFGDEGLFNQETRSYSASAKTDALILTLSRTDLHHIINECPVVSKCLLEIYSQEFPCRFSKK